MEASLWLGIPELQLLITLRAEGLHKPVLWNPLIQQKLNHRGRCYHVRLTSRHGSIYIRRGTDRRTGALHIRYRRVSQTTRPDFQLTRLPASTLREQIASSGDSSLRPVTKRLSLTMDFLMFRGTNRGHIIIFQDDFTNYNQGHLSWKIGRHPLHRVLARSGT